MSDSHSEQRWSPKGIIRRYGGGMASLLSRRLESRSSSEFHHRHEYGHAARFLSECRIGFSECPQGFPDCRPGWRNALEEPLSHSKTAMASKRHELVGMLPSLLSSLAISPASSNPRVSGKDVCSRKFFLPAERDDGKTKSLSPEEPELSPPANMVPCKPVALRVVGTWDDSPPFASPDDFASYNTLCENAVQDRGVDLGDANESSLQTFGVSSGDANESSIQTLGDSNESSLLTFNTNAIQTFQTFGVSSGDANESSIQTFVETLGDSNESSLQTFNRNAIQTFGGKSHGEVSQDAVVSLGGFSTQALESYSEPPVVMQHACVSTEDVNELAVMSPFFDSSREEQYSRNSSGTCSNKNAAVGGVSMEGIPGSFRLPPSRPPRWDDWWTCQLDECNGQGGHSVNRTMLGHEVKQQFFAPAKINAMEQADEEDLEEGYLILDEHGNQKEGSKEVDGDGEGYDGDAEGYTLQALDVNQENGAYDKDETTQDKLGKGDDKEVDGGICSENNSKAFKEDDIWSDEDLISSQVKGFPPPISILANETHPGLPGHMPRTFWRSVKRGGRFVLQEVQARPREFFRATRENGRLRLQLVRPDSDPVGTATETLDTLQPDEVGTKDQGETSGAGSSPDLDLVERVTETLDASQADVGGTEGKGESAEVGPGQNGTNQISEKVLGVRTALDTGLKEIMDQICTRQITKRKEISSRDQSGTNHFSEMTLEVKTPSDAGKKETMDQTGTDQITERKETLGPSQNAMKQISKKTIGPLDAGQKETTTQISADQITKRMESFGPGKNGTNQISEDRITRRMESFGPGQNGTNQISEKMFGVRTPVDAGWVEITDQIGRDQMTEREDGTKLDARQTPDLKEPEREDGTKLDARQTPDLKELESCSHSRIATPTGHANEEQFRQDYQHACFNSTYGFDNTLNVLSPSQTLLQFPIQPAVR